MLKTIVKEIDIGGLIVKLNVVSNADELYMDAIEQAETPVWLDVWPAGMALSNFIWHNIKMIDKKVLELGAGLGLTGIVTAMKGANVIQTDYIPEALELAHKSAELNNLSNIIQKTADWRKFDISEKFDCIIGSDFLYLPDTHQYLKTIFETNLKPGGIIYISDPGRYDSKVLLLQMAEEGWNITDEIHSVHKDGFNYNIHILELKRMETDKKQK